MGSNSTYSHVDIDVVNPLISGCLTGQLHLIVQNLHRSLAARFTLKQKLSVPTVPNKTLLLSRGISSAALLGTFEILTTRLRNGNEGRPLSLYQEAWCGLISGSGALLAPYSFRLACNRVRLHKFTHILQNQSASASALALPTLRIGSVSGIAVATIIAAFAGMLTSYDRSRNYFIQTEGLSNWNAQICASIVSGFCSAASAYPLPYLGALINVVEMRRVPRPQLVKPKVYTRFLNRFYNAARFCVVQYAIYEHVRGVEWTNILQPSREKIAN